MTRKSENFAGTEQERDELGHFRPGVSGNPAGRQKGRPDKSSAAKEELVSKLLPKAIEKLEAAINKDEKWAIELVVTYSLPKPRPIDPDEMLELEERLRDLEQPATRKVR